MKEHAPAIFIALEGSAFAAGIRGSTWAYMTANVGHILSLTVFAGAIAGMDLRLTGLFAATSPAAILRGARKVAICAFAGLALTGFVMFSAEASHVAVNPMFQLKVALIAAGLLNIAYFEYALAPKVRRLKPLEPIPREARTAAYISLGLWLLVAACGRSIAYF